MKNLEVDALMANIIVRARRAEREGQKLVIGLETDWIPGYGKDAMQDNAVGPLVKEIAGIGDTLRSMGIDNAVIVHTKKEKLARDVLVAARDNFTDLSNVVVLASKTTIENDKRFKYLASTKNEKRAFLAAIDPSNIEKTVLKPGELCEVDVVGMLVLALELSAGKAPQDASLLTLIDDYDQELRTVTFLPKARAVECGELRKRYMAQLDLLRAL